MRSIQLVGLLGEPPGKVDGEFVRLVLVQPVLRHEARQEGAIAAARHVVAGGDGEIGAVSSLKPTVL